MTTRVIAVVEIGLRSISFEVAEPNIKRFCAMAKINNLFSSMGPCWQFESQGRIMRASKHTG